jgi:transcriptional regulator NrdR family protein
MTNTGPLCPHCGQGVDKSYVVDTRKSGRQIRRRRTCSRCDGNYTTWEGAISFQEKIDSVRNLVDGLLESQSLLRQEVKSLLETMKNEHKSNATGELLPRARPAKDDDRRRRPSGRAND